MADLSFKNVINGELVDAADGARYDVIDPSTGEVYATAPHSGPEDVANRSQFGRVIFAPPPHRGKTTLTSLPCKPRSPFLFLK